MQECQQGFQGSERRSLDIDSLALGADGESFQGGQVVHADILKVGFFIFVLCDKESSTGNGFFETGGVDLDSECGLDLVVLDERGLRSALIRGLSGKDAP